jgi:GT2 family glycosyltransferase
MTSLDQIGIGIPTRDRWDELAVTLQKLAEYGLGTNETIVLDDGSREPVPADLRVRFPHVRFERTTRARYVAGGRNDLARWLTKPLFLQIDNDAFPVEGELAAAAAWLIAKEDALALAFVIAERDDFETAVRALPPDPAPCHYFIGCGALIKRALFLDLGGYEENLEYVAEEIGLTLHAQSRGLQVYQYPALTIRHYRSPLSRDLGMRAALNVRNELLIAGLYYPFFFMLLRWPVYLIKVLAGGLFPRHATIRGALAAARLYPTIWRKREPVSVRPFLRWKRLPVPVKLVPGGRR